MRFSDDVYFVIVHIFGHEALSLKFCGEKFVTASSYILLQMPLGSPTLLRNIKTAGKDRLIY